MAKVNLTNRKLQSLKPALKRIDYFDKTLPGFCVRVTPRGIKTFSVLYRHAGRLRRYTLGTYPKLSLADAHDLARAALRDAALGRDPASRKKQENLAGTFADLAEGYMERWSKKRKRTWSADQRMIDRYLLPPFRHVRVTDITRQDVRALLETIAETTPIQANRIHALISSIFNWAIGVDLAQHNPCAGLRRPSKENQRDRVLSEDEIRRLWNAAAALPDWVADLFRLTLFTAQRPGAEVRRMRWQDLDLKSGWWTIPAEFSKNGLSHRVPLSSQSLRILKSRSTRSQWVFAGKDNRNHVQNLQPPFGQLRALAGIEGIRLHDLRRTAASMMTGMGIPRLTVSKILNHSEGGVTQVYDRHSYDPEKREALEKWGRRLTVIVSDLKEAKVD